MAGTLQLGTHGCALGTVVTTTTAMATPAGGASFVDQAPWCVPLRAETTRLRTGPGSSGQQGAELELEAPALEDQSLPATPCACQDGRRTSTRWPRLALCSLRPKTRGAPSTVSAAQVQASTCACLSTGTQALWRAWCAHASKGRGDQATLS